MGMLTKPAAFYSGTSWERGYVRCANLNRLRSGESLILDGAQPSKQKSFFFFLFFAQHFCVPLCRFVLVKVLRWLRAWRCMQHALV